MRLRVVCALSDTMAILSPIKALIMVDLPTFGRPYNGYEAGFKMFCFIHYMVDPLGTYPKLESTNSSSVRISFYLHRSYGHSLRYANSYVLLNRLIPFKTMPVLDSLFMSSFQGEYHIPNR